MGNRHSLSSPGKSRSAVPSIENQVGGFQKVTSKTRGLDLAAEIIEKAFHKSRGKILTDEDSRLSHHGRS